MYFICNSTFAILEDLGVLKDGLGPKHLLAYEENFSIVDLDVSLYEFTSTYRKIVFVEQRVYSKSPTLNGLPLFKGSNL
jgi:hypothetical protein